MNDQEYIRKAVELADGFNMDEQAIVIHEWSDFCFIDDPSQHVLDALAAQLVRQVDARAKGVEVEVFDGFARIDSAPPRQYERIAIAEGPDRTMNTIKVIVDSKVLE